MSALQLISVPTSDRLFHPVAGRLQSFSPSNISFREERRAAERDIEALIRQKNYPCVAALQSYRREEYFVGFYENFGEGGSWCDLRRDLKHFLLEQIRSDSVYLTFWAIFPEDKAMGEEEFEEKMWRELSFLTSEEKKSTDWKPGTTTNPEDENFCFQLFGEAFFVVGLHPGASRLGRKFTRPAMIFNVFRQFEKLVREGRYHPMVAVNRARDAKFQGEANPMVVEHGDSWETIQFSGKKNPKTWKCPFRFLSSASKSKDEATD